MVERQAVTIAGLTRIFERRRKRQAPVVALDGITLAIPEGEIHGLLGPNGAGKTTLVKILATVLLPSAGRALVLGRDVVEETRLVRPVIGIAFGGERGLYPRLTARQNLHYWGALYRLRSERIRKRTQTLLERVGLADRADEKVETYSQGMKQRLHLARALVGDAQILFLDEPTSSMDPVAARMFRNLIADLRGEGKTILLATHDMLEAERMCDRVTLIDRGKIIATESPRTLGALISRFRRIDAEGVGPPLLDELRVLPGVRAVSVLDGAARIEVGEESATEVVLRHLLDRGITAVSTSLPSLEEVYVQLVGERGAQI